jgi:hypothetical protein
LINYSVEKYDLRFFDDELKAQNIIGPPDCYLRVDQAAFFFENKDILINASIKASYDFEIVINEIKKKLLSENGRGVGIGQIIANIQKLLNKTNKFDEGFNEKTSIYPILLVHDNMYDTMGLNRILGSWFYSELMKLKAEGLDVSNVKPLILMNIDSLILVSDVLKQGKTSLQQLCDAYFDNFQVRNGNLTQTLIPFSNFVVNYLNQSFPTGWKSESLMRYLFARTEVNDKKDATGDNLY